MAFYKLEVSRERRFVEGSDANDWESITCSKNSDHQRAGKRVTKLFVDILTWNVVDFSRTMLSDIVVTGHAVEILRNAKLTGFEVQPVEVATTPERHDRIKFPALFEFLVTGYGGRAHEDSGIVRLRECTECGLAEYSAFKNGIMVDSSSYDGSDFFTVIEYPKYVLVSERAKAAIERNRLTNVTFVESTALKWPRGIITPR